MGQSLPYLAQELKRARDIVVIAPELQQRLSEGTREGQEKFRRASDCPRMQNRAGLRAKAGGREGAIRWRQRWLASGFGRLPRSLRVGRRAGCPDWLSGLNVGLGRVGKVAFRGIGRAGLGPDRAQMGLASGGEQSQPNCVARASAAWRASAVDSGELPRGAAAQATGRA